MKNPPSSPVPALCVSLISDGIIRHRVDTNFISHFIEHIHTCGRRVEDDIYKFITGNKSSLGGVGAD